MLPFLFLLYIIRININSHPQSREVPGSRTVLKSVLIITYVIYKVPRFSDDYGKSANF